MMLLTICYVEPNLDQRGYRPLALDLWSKSYRCKISAQARVLKSLISSQDIRE